MILKLCTLLGRVRIDRNVMELIKSQISVHFYSVALNTPLQLASDICTFVKSKLVPYIQYYTLTSVGPLQ